MIISNRQQITIGFNVIACGMRRLITSIFQSLCVRQVNSSAMSVCLSKNVLYYKSKTIILRIPSEREEASNI